MRIAFLHPTTGKMLLIPVQQVIVYNDDGQPVAITYEHAGLIVHTDVGKPDMSAAVDHLRVARVEPLHGG